MAEMTLNPLSWARTRARVMPYVARRDEKIRELVSSNKKVVEELARAKKRLTAFDRGGVERPSFRRYIYAARRIAGHLHELDELDRGHLLTRKLRSYSFAQSHGVSIPQIYGLWDRPEDINWDELPDQVVIKSNSGSSARGVVPLHRVSGHWTKVTTSGPITPEEIIDLLHALEAKGLVGGPYFAEELLGGGIGNALPVDIKVHAFYGEVSHVLLRTAHDHGNRHANTFRMILPDGTDAGPVIRNITHDPDIPIPDTLGELIDVAKRLSLCIPRAFVRIDMYDVDGRIVFGELTPRPGSSMDYGREYGERLGHKWEQAQARLLNDVIDGADSRLRFGPGPRELQVGESSFLPSVDREAE